VNHFLLNLQPLAAAWADWMLAGALKSALILVAVSLLWRLFLRGRSAHLAYALFALALLPLMTPGLWSFQLDVNPSAAIAQKLPVLVQEIPAATSVAHENAAATNDRLVAPTEEGRGQMVAGRVAAAPPSLWLPMLFLGWCFGVALLLLGFLVDLFRTNRLAASAHHHSKEDLRRITRATIPNGGLGSVRLRACPRMTGPAAWGILRPTILMPPALLSQLDDQQLAWVMGHELAHHRRHDLLFASLQRLLVIAWFFHPLVWWLSRRLDHLRECACDESAQAMTRNQGQSCAHALLNLAAAAPDIRRIPFALQTLHHNKITMKNRIQRLMTSSHDARRGMAPLALPGIVLAAGLCLTSVNLRLTPEDPAAAVAKAQSWLMSQQSADGSWSGGPQSDGAAGEFHTAGVTGAVLLSLERNQAAEGAKQRKQAIAKGLHYLEASVDADSGLFGGDTTKGSMPDHALATQAWLGAPQSSRSAQWQAIAESAVRAIIHARNPYGAWRYQAEPNGDQDTFVTSLMVHTLALAAAQGIDIPRDAIEGASYFLNEMTDPETGRTGYLTRGSLDSRLVAKKESHPVKYTELYTAMAIGARADLGADPTTSAPILKGLALLAAKKPSWSTSADTVDYYYWYYGGEAMQLVGGKFAQGWHAALADALLPHQIQEGDAAGSWPAVDAWSHDKATIHATAWATLALQASLSD